MGCIGEIPRHHDEVRTTNRNYIAGFDYTFDSNWGIGVQLPVWKDRDAGANAEPEDIGGTFVHLSPGVSVALGDKTQLYGFVQVPLYQNVNGVQLIADWSVAAGLSHRFQDCPG